MEHKWITNKRIIYSTLSIVTLIILFCIGIRIYNHHQYMCRSLLKLQAENRAYCIFKSDSAANKLVHYFNYPWHSRNNRMLAYYLLGRAHADMGEVSQAIEDYHTAVGFADTTSDNCDYYILSAIYGQMAVVFHEQYLPEDELEARKKYIHYTLAMGDTLEAIDGYRMLERPYYLMCKTDSVLHIDYMSRKKMLALGDTLHASSALITPSYINIEKGNYIQAKEEIDIVRKYAGIFDSNGRLKPGHEMYYYTIGYYYDAINQLDSAEYYYRNVLAAGILEAGYKGLLSVYSKYNNADSISKYAFLFADANDNAYRLMKSEMVHKTNAQYKYARHQHIARHYEQQSSHRLRIIIVILFISVITVSVLFFHHRKIQNTLHEKENKLLYLHLQLMKVTDSLRMLQNESTIQEQSFQSQVSDLLKQKKSLEEQLIETDSLLQNFYDNVLVQKFRMMADPNNKVYASRVEWDQLISFFQTSFPKFTTAVNGIGLKDKEWRIIILTELGFQTADMCSAMRMSGNSITYIKRALSKKIFGKEGLVTFQISLKTAIVTGRLQY